MRFTLVYRGDLPPKAGAAEKARIRKAFDPQLRRLWNDLGPAAMNYQDPAYQPADCYVGRAIGDLEYIPLITERLSLRAELEITLLSASRPGGLINNAGDIDNRLKTLLDALSAPTPQQASAQGTVAANDSRVFCLLDDDGLITRLDIANDRLLTLDPGSREALVLIRVRPTANRVTWANIGIVA